MDKKDLEKALRDPNGAYNKDLIKKLLDNASQYDFKNLYGNTAANTRENMLSLLGAGLSDKYKVNPSDKQGMLDAVNDSMKGDKLHDFIDGSIPTEGAYYPDSGQIEIGRSGRPYDLGVLAHENKHRINKDLSNANISQEEYTRLLKTTDPIMDSRFLNKPPENTYKNMLNKITTKTALQDAVLSPHHGNLIDINGNNIIPSKEVNPTFFEKEALHNLTNGKKFAHMLPLLKGLGIAGAAGSLYSAGADASEGNLGEAANTLVEDFTPYGLIAPSKISKESELPPEKKPFNDLYNRLNSKLPDESIEEKTSRMLPLR